MKPRDPDESHRAATPLELFSAARRLPSGACRQVTGSPSRFWRKNTPSLPLVTTIVPLSKNG